MQVETPRRSVRSTTPPCARSTPSSCGWWPTPQDAPQPARGGGRGPRRGPPPSTTDQHEHLYRAVETPLVVWHPALPKPGHRVGGLSQSSSGSTVLTGAAARRGPRRPIAADAAGERSEAHNDIVFSETFFRTHRSTAFDGRWQLVRTHEDGGVDRRPPRSRRCGEDSPREASRMTASLAAYRGSPDARARGRGAARTKDLGADHLERRLLEPSARTSSPARSLSPQRLGGLSRPSVPVLDPVRRPCTTRPTTAGSGPSRRSRHSGSARPAVPRTRRGPRGHRGASASHARERPAAAGSAIQIPQFILPGCPLTWTWPSAEVSTSTPRSANSRRTRSMASSSRMARAVDHVSPVEVQVARGILHRGSDQRAARPGTPYTASAPPPAAGSRSPSRRWVRCRRGSPHPGPP